MESRVLACGYTKPIARIVAEDRGEIVKLICLQQLLFMPKPAIDQFVEGLEEVSIAFILVNWCNFSHTWLAILNKGGYLLSSY